MSDPKTVDLDKMDKLIEAYDAAEANLRESSGVPPESELDEAARCNFLQADNNLYAWVRSNRHAIAAALARIKEAGDAE